MNASTMNRSFTGVLVGGGIAATLRSPDAILPQRRTRPVAALGAAVGRERLDG